MCTSVMPRETLANDPATDPWATALCTHLPPGGPLPTGEVNCLPAQLIQACQETARSVERQLCDLCWWAHTVYITPSCAIKPWYSVIFSSSGLLWQVLPRHSQLPLTTCGDILDSSSTLYGLSTVTVSWKYCYSEMSVLNCSVDPLGCGFSPALMKVEPCQAGWSILPSAPGCHTSDDSLLPALRAEDVLQSFSSEAQRA